MHISSFALYEEDTEDEREATASFYANATTRTSWQEKNVWTASEPEPNLSPTGGSGSFGRLFKTTVVRKQESTLLDTSAHTVKLNLHQFHTESGDSLGDDTEHWARLTF